MLMKRGAGELRNRERVVGGLAVNMIERKIRKINLSHIIPVETAVLENSRRTRGGRNPGASDQEGKHTRNVTGFWVFETFAEEQEVLSKTEERGGAVSIEGSVRSSFIGLNA